MARVVHGKPDVVHLALVVLLAEGHLLVEDVPGVGKTTLAKALAGSVDASVRRIQFTPDLLPSDVTGVSVYDQETREFEFKPGAVFANIVVADEINRASPKTQSALLECMAERQVTVDGVSYELARPFLVVATQNPIEMEGTYPLPEAQRDRFTARVSMGYPDRDAELAMLGGRATVDPLTALGPVVDAGHVRTLVAAVGRLHVAEPLRQYVVSLVEATRRSGAEAVLHVMPKFCEPHMLMYPELRKRLDAEGIPQLLIETEHEGIPLESLRTRVEALVERALRKRPAYA